MNSPANVQEVFADLSASLKGLNVVSIRRPRKWKGKNFTERQIPIAIVTADCYNKQQVFDAVGEVAARNHVAVMMNHGYRNSRSEILIYINLKAKK